jgi:hypothetical protein
VESVRRLKRRRQWLGRWADLRTSAENFVESQAHLEVNPDAFNATSEKSDDRWRGYESDTSCESDGGGPWNTMGIPKPKRPQPIGELEWDKDQQKALNLFYDMANENGMPKPTTLEAIRSMFIQVADPWGPLTAKEEEARGTTRVCRRKPPRAAGTIARWRAAKHILHAGCYSPMRADTEEMHDAYWARFDEGVEGVLRGS